MQKQQYKSDGKKMNEMKTKKIKQSFCISFFFLGNNLTMFKLKQINTSHPTYSGH